MARRYLPLEADIMSLLPLAPIAFSGLMCVLRGRETTRSGAPAGTCDAFVLIAAMNPCPCGYVRRSASRLHLRCQRRQSLLEGAVSAFRSSSQLSARHFLGIWSKRIVVPGSPWLSPRSCAWRGRETPTTACRGTDPGTRPPDTILRPLCPFCTATGAWNARQRAKTMRSVSGPPQRGSIRDAPSATRPSKRSPETSPLSERHIGRRRPPNAA